MRGAKMSDNNSSSSSGLEPNVAGLLCYVLGFITAIIFIVIEKENKFVRFHAFQSLFFSIAIIVLNILLGVIYSIIPFLAFVHPIISLAILVLWIFLMVKAYQNVLFKLPVIGDVAAKQTV
jgi:uncharacterized membrane protein